MPEAIRVCYVITDLSGFGGAQKQLWQLLANLPKGRFRPTIICLDRDLIAEAFRDLGVPIAATDYRGTMDIVKIRQIRRLISSERPDVLHCFLTSGNFYGLLAAVGLGVPVRIAGERSFGSRRRGIRRLVYPAVIRLADAIVTNSAKNGEWLSRAYAIPTTRVKVIPNGCRVPVPGETPDQVRRRFGIDRREVFIATVSKLTPEKDVECLVRATARLIQSGLPARVVVVGGGPHLASVTSQINALGLQHSVHLAGYLPAEQALSVTRACDLFVLPSRFEGMPNALMEAMAFGRPSVASDVGGIPELLDSGAAGLQFPAGDDKALARAIARLAGDEELRHRLGAHAKQRLLSEFSVEAMVEKHVDLYYSLLGRSRLSQQSVAMPPVRMG